MPQARAGLPAFGAGPPENQRCVPAKLGRNLLNFPLTYSDKAASLQGMDNITLTQNGVSSDAYRDADGIIRWKTNNVVPFADMLEANGITGDELARHVAAREKDNDAFFAEYRRRQPAKPSAEAMYEMRAAFGPGQVIVDVITGRRVRT
jgi:hypothetical protein